MAVNMLSHIPSPVPWPLKKTAEYFVVQEIIVIFAE